MKKQKAQFDIDDQIMLKTPKQCIIEGDTKQVTVLPNYLLTYVKGSPKHCYFKVSYNAPPTNDSTAKNGDIVRISRTSFEGLSFHRIDKTKKS